MNKFIKKLLCTHPNIQEEGRYVVPYTTILGNEEITRIVKVCPSCGKIKTVDIAY